jgi:type IV pilus assembly protein PilC
MPVFTFSGRDASGKRFSSERVAESKQALAAQLRRERFALAGAIREKGKEFALPFVGRQKVSAKDLAIFFRQFAVMIDAGLPLVQCLELMAGNQENTGFQRALTGVRTSVEGGATLSQGLRNYPRIFNDLTVNMVEAGETGGILDVILDRLATYTEKAVKMKQALRSALIYPVSVITLAVLIVAALLKWVVPIFTKLFDGLGVELPLATRFVIRLSEIVGAFWWWVILLIILLVIGLRMFRQGEQGRLVWDRMMLNLPVLGMLLRKIAVARFSRTLGTLITSGVPILEALVITARSSGNAVIERTLLQVRRSIEEGRTLVDPLKESGVFPNMVTQMIGVGEATGSMDAMLQKIADFYESEVDAATKDLLTLLEPVMIAILGVFVGGIVISLYLPLFKMIGKLAG